MQNNQNRKKIENFRKGERRKEKKREDIIKGEEESGLGVVLGWHGWPVLRYVGIPASHHWLHTA